MSELDTKEVLKASDVVKEGDDVEFVVLSIDARDQRFSLSRKAHLKGLEGEELKKYMSTITVSEPQTVLGAAFSQAKEDQAQEKTNQKQQAPS